jgi:outer membrane protein insertion porin family
VILQEGCEGVRIFTTKDNKLQLNGTTQPPVAAVGVFRAEAALPATLPTPFAASSARALVAALAFSVVAPFAWMQAAAQAPEQTPAQATPAADQAQYGNAQTLCQPEVIGNRRIPRESVLARLFSRQGNLYDPAIVERDFNSLWNTGYFENVRIERVDTPTCVRLIVYVKEKPTIRTIDYKGLNAVSLSDVEERFKKVKLPLTVDSQYDPTRIKRAETVLEELLSEHGHQFATIKTEIKTIPPASVGITFDVKEGPTVKVGKILFDGNKNLSDRTLRAAMKNLRPIGIPHSIILENLFARTFDASKLDEDAERVRYAYRDRGYFKALTGEPKTHIRNTTGFNPFTFHATQGKKIDILIPVEEGERYRLAGITFKGNKNVQNTRVLRAQFAIKDGDYFNSSQFSKGLEQLRKAYGELGYINFVGTPIPHTDDAKGTISLEIDIDEGKAYKISRIEFQGNSITRDKVIRRELLVDEGAVYNSRLVDLSLLRLNQLSYFDNLTAANDVETRLNEADGTVDLLIKLKEKGKNSIGLNGGVSGLSGAFIGLNYETNNFLGLGETLTAGKCGRPEPKHQLRFYRALPAQQAAFAGRPGVFVQVRLQPRQSIRRRYGSRHQPGSGPAVADDELQHHHHRHHDIAFRAAAPLLRQQGCGPRRRELFSFAFFGDDLQQQHPQRLPVARLQVRGGGAEPVEWHYHVGGDTHVYAVVAGPRAGSA